MKRRSVMGLSAGMAMLGASVSSTGRAQLPLDQSRRGFRWLHEFAANGKGTSDDTGTFQRAIDFIRGIALRTGDTSCLPALLIPSGRYVLNATIETAPWVKLRSIGGVLLDFSGLPPALDGLACRNETTLSATDLRFPGNRSPFLDGTGGTISILGPGTARAEGWGVVMGNREAGFTGAVREAGGHNVVITGWRGGLHIDPISTYLCAWFSSRFEQNRESGVHVNANVGRSINSGERMTFVDCTFAGSARAIDIDADSMDFVFDACSFDFNGDVVHFGPRASHGTVAFSHCHIEGIDGLLVNSTAAGKQLRTVFRDSIVLPRHWKRKELSNAPRLLVAGSSSFSASGIEWRFESAEQGALTALISDEVPVEALAAMSFQRVHALPWRGSVLNADSVFALDKPGTQTSALTHWVISGSSRAPVAGEIVGIDMSLHTNRTIGPKQALRLRLPEQDGAACAVATRTPFAVSPGQNIFAACTALAETAGDVEFAFQFYAAPGVPLTISKSKCAAGEFLSTSAMVPAGAGLAVLKVTFANWAGAIEVSELAVWRSS